MDEAFKEVTQIFQNGALFMLKLLILYIVLPELIGIIVLGGILRIRGRLLGILLIGVAIVGFYLFVLYGLPQITDMDFTIQLY